MSVATRPTAPVTISRSKVEQPVLAGHWVRRPRLEARLDRVLTRSLAVVTAPAGHGKTSTIAAWLRLRNRDAAWVTLDRRDTDLTRFAVHVAVALEHVSPGIEADLLRLLVGPGSDGAPRPWRGVWRDPLRPGARRDSGARRCSYGRCRRGRGICRGFGARRPAPSPHDPDLPWQASHSLVASADGGRCRGADGRRSPLFGGGDERAAAPGDRRGY